MRRLLPLIAAVTLAAPAAAQTQREPSSGVEFPVMMTVADGSQQQLMGTGIRTRTVLNVKVYAFGLYVDAAGARAALGRWNGRTAQQLAGDATFYGQLLQMGFPMTMRLVMTRNVSGEQMSEAFDGAMRPRVVAAAGRGMPGGEAALGQFRSYFSVDRLTEGAELVFTCTANGALHSKVAGEAKPVIESRALCWALFDVYLGAEPISASGKRGVVAGFPALLGSR
jgi:hypothetical protein